MNVIKRKKYFVGVFVLGFLLLASRLWGQDMNITSSSPEMALLMRSVNNPVNLNTGIVNVQVPLFFYSRRRFNLTNRYKLSDNGY